jgi:hypothetical protein
MDRVEQTLHIGFKPHKDFKRFREIIKQINEAAVNQKTIDMIYKTMSRGGEENRRLNLIENSFCLGKAAS